MQATTYPSIGATVQSRASHAEQAFRLLHVGFVAAPILAGLDKFAGLLTDWSKYIAVPDSLPMSASAFLAVIGIVEIAAGALVAIKPKIGALIVAAWLGLIIVNLLILGDYYDVALRDVGLMLGALALWRLSLADESARLR